MIVAKRKTLAEIEEMLLPYRTVLLAGCGTCVSFCSAGGTKEVDALAEELLTKNTEIFITKTTVPRQCAEKSISRLQEKVEDADVVLSMACGNGVQAVADRFPNKMVLPALNTSFIGVEKEPGVWTENCIACGDCILWRTGGICPVTRCAKSLLNGACGGASNGNCEVKGRPCAWQEIYHALKRLGMLHYLKQKPQAKSWPVHPEKILIQSMEESESTQERGAP